MKKRETYRKDNKRHLLLGACIMISMVLSMFVGTAYATDEPITNDPGVYEGATNGQNIFAQSFRATKTGIIKSISISGCMDEGTPTTLKIYEGDGTSGPLLHMQSVSPQNTSHAIEGGRYIFIDIPLDAIVDIFNGKQYTFEFSPEASIAIGYTANTYLGGTGYTDGISDADHDLGFKVVQGDVS